MSITFEDFLQSAETLLHNSEAKEIDLRNAMSRAYYALFHLCKLKADTLPIPEGFAKYKGSHEKIIAKFENHPDENLQLIGREINRRKKLRCKADYDIQENITVFEREEHFNAIKRIIQKLKQIP